MYISTCLTPYTLCIGVFVRQLVEDGLAQRQGDVSIGDELLAINGKEVLELQLQVHISLYISRSITFFGNE